MIRIYKELIERIHGEIEELENVVHKIQKSWAQVLKSDEHQSAYIDSVAFNLHSFYSGLEKVFELIARHVDDQISESETWHKDLLNQMSEESEELRPAVIGHDTASSLDKFLRFRHLVRNIYTFNLNPDKLSELIAELPDLWKKIRKELTAFAQFIEDLAQEK
jgi:hypothetical protein